MSNEYIDLKWGTLKAWNVAGNEAAIAALKLYAEQGMSLSVAAQRNTADQKEALCTLIDVINGPITNDWSGEVMTKDEAKRYIREYGR